MWSTKAHGVPGALAISYHYIRTETSWSLDYGESHEVRGHYEEGFYVVSHVGNGLKVLKGAKEIRALDHHRTDLIGQVCLKIVQVDNSVGMTDLLNLYAF